MFLSIDLVESISVEIFHLLASAAQFHLTERNQSSIEALHPLRLAFTSSSPAFLIFSRLSEKPPIPIFSRGRQAQRNEPEDKLSQVRSEIRLQKGFLH